MTAILTIVVATTLAVGGPAADVATRYADLDALFEIRGMPGVDQRALTLARDLASAHPADYGACWRLARAAFLIAQRAPEKATQERVGDEGYQAAARALAARPDGVEALYWGACSLGVYARAAGVMASIRNGVAGKIEGMLTRANTLAPTLHGGGPAEALGRYWYALPWPLKDLKRSRALLEQSLRHAPSRVRARAYLGDTLLALGSTAEARDEYRRCASSTIGLPHNPYGAQWLVYCKQQLSELEVTTD